MQWGVTADLARSLWVWKDSHYAQAVSERVHPLTKKLPRKVASPTHAQAAAPGSNSIDSRTPSKSGSSKPRNSTIETTPVSWSDRNPPAPQCPQRHLPPLLGLRTRSRIRRRRQFPSSAPTLPLIRARNSPALESAAGGPSNCGTTRMWPVS